MVDLTKEQKDQLLDLIKTFTKDSLGPLVHEAVEAQLGKALETQTQSATSLADAVKQLAAANTHIPAEKQDTGMLLGRMVRALAVSKGDPDKSIAFAKKEWGEGDPVIKALEAGTATSGGFIVPPNYSADIIELLTPQTIVRAMGARTMPLVNGTLQVPKITAGSTAAYIGESQDIAESQPTFGMLNMTAKKLAALVPLSNDLIRFSSPSADSIVRDDTVRAFRVKEDITFIRAQGTEFTPKGLRYWAPTANILTVNATVNLANVTEDLGKLVLALISADVGMVSPGWMMAPRTWNALMTVRDGNGNFAFRDEMLRGTLWGFPFRMTTQIPINLAYTGSAESEVYLVDFADVVIGEASSLTIDVSTEAAYVSSGSLVSAFSRDQTIVRVIAHHDLAVRHAESVAVLADVDWVTI
jgi:HK97 family phage major capsid protein